MKKWIKKTIFSTFLFVVAILSTVTVSALTITETVDEDIADGTIIMGITKFEPNVVITALRASDATFNDVIFNYNKPNYKGVNIYYLLSGSWFEIDEENNAHPIENEELIQQLNEVDIYYVNNNEKMLEISYSENVPTGYELIFETNNSAKNDEIKYEAGKIKVPATINEVKVLLQNTETKEKEIIDVFEKNARNDVTFVNTSTMDVTNLVQLKDALNNKDIKTINITKNITDVAERIVIDRKVEVNGNGNKITFTSAVNEAAYGSRHGILVNADDVTITD
ncbi:MAG: hypothetical protein J6A29_05575, partial [Clostridia bacterium]|nr:hypothetical protein [Clostridia bacterium]